MEVPKQELGNQDSVTHEIIISYLRITLSNFFTTERTSTQGLFVKINKDIIHLILSIRNNVKKALLQLF
jgi:hypothetical protein